VAFSWSLAATFVSCNLLLQQKGASTWSEYRLETERTPCLSTQCVHSRHTPAVALVVAGGEQEEHA